MSIKRINLSKITRFSLEWSSEGTAAFTNSPNGDFVSYEDHVAREEILLTEIQRLRAALNRVNDRLELLRLQLQN